ncbi:heme exporter protein CcmD [Colwelliaceae bacterium MEBiC 14330]
MQFSSFSEFIDMGGYGFYVWLSFGTTALILSFLLVSSKAGHQKIINEIAKRQQRDDKLRQAREIRKQEKRSINEVTE